MLTASEGFVASAEAVARLHGYSTALMPVEHMDPESFRELYREYRARHGCKLSYELLHSIAGGAPGYLPTLCQGLEAVERLVDEAKTLLDSALATALEELARQGASPEPRKLIETVYTTLGGEPLSPLENPLAYTVGKLLTEHNIAYPLYERGRVRFKPQIPLYRTLLRIALEKNTNTIADVETGEILRAAAES